MWQFLAVLLKEKFCVGYHFIFLSRIRSRFPQPHEASQSEATVILCLTSALLNKTFSCFGKHLSTQSTSRDPGSPFKQPHYGKNTQEKSTEGSITNTFRKQQLVRWEITYFSTLLCARFFCYRRITKSKCWLLRERLLSWLNILLNKITYKIYTKYKLFQTSLSTNSLCISLKNSINSCPNLLEGHVH